MKTNYQKKAPRAHLAHLQTSFQTTILFLLVITLTALAFSSCSNRVVQSKRPHEKDIAGSSYAMKLTTGNRTSGPQIVVSK